MDADTLQPPPPARPARGRPRSFDRDAGLGAALRVFWDQGYEGTSVADLLAALAISPPSLYGAYGSKGELFRQALLQYSRGEGDWASALDWSAGSARDDIEGMLRRNADACAEPAEPSPCMVVLGAALGTPGDPQARAFVGELRRRGQAHLRERLERGVAEQELPAGTDTAALAAFCATVLQGIALQGRDGAGHEALHRVVDLAMDAWDAQVNAARPQPAPQRR